MRYLTEQTNGNIHDNGTIEITSNSIYDSSKHPKNHVTYENDTTFCEYYSKENDQIEHIIAFDFKEKLIRLESYTIKSRSSGKNNVNLKNWVIEVSNEGNYGKWIIVDLRENDSTLIVIKRKKVFIVILDCVKQVIAGTVLIIKLLVFLILNFMVNLKKHRNNYLN